jgi:DNA polymerase I-like protein with 3'-5' exonuclease and polymerase domains
MDVITLDFETYYTNTDLGFKKQTTEEYVRDPRFHAIGVAVKVNDGATRWCSSTHNQIKAFLKTFDWDNALAVAHNAIFDMAILNWHFDIRPKGIADTLSMGRAIHGIEVGNSLDKLTQHYKLGQKGDDTRWAINLRREDFTAQQLAQYGAYCVNDVNLTYDLFRTLMPMFKMSELKLVDLTIRMFTEPCLRLDPDQLSKHLVEVRDSKAKLLEAAGANLKNLMSNNKFAELLKGLGVEPPTKISPTTGKETLALAKSDEGFKALAEHPDVRVQTLVAARLGNKTTLEETRTERLIGIAGRGLIPVPLSYYAAHTGRWGGADKLNFQNFPSRGENAGKLKSAILAPEGHVIIDCDSSQIEARVLAWFAGQEDLIEVFEKNNAEIAAGLKKKDMKFDPYKLMAAQIYNKSVEEVLDTKENPERFVGKTTILGAGYGMGAVKFQAQLKTFGTTISLEEAAHIIKVYRDTYPWIPAVWKSGGLAIEAMSKGRTATWGNGVVQIGADGILMPNGMYQRYPNLKKVLDKDGKQQYIYDSRKGAVKLYGGKLTENICQGLARIIIGEQMLKIAKRYRVVLTVHDAVACVAPKEEAEEAMAFVMDCMRQVPEWAKGIPLNCEAGYGENYGDC